MTFQLGFDTFIYMKTSLYTYLFTINCNFSLHYNTNRSTWLKCELFIKMVLKWFVNIIYKQYLNHINCNINNLLSLNSFLRSQQKFSMIYFLRVLCKSKFWLLTDIFLSWTRCWIRIINITREALTRYIRMHLARGIYFLLHKYFSYYYCKYYF